MPPSPCVFRTAYPGSTECDWKIRHKFWLRLSNVVHTAHCCGAPDSRPSYGSATGSGSHGSHWYRCGDTTAAAASAPSAAPSYGPMACILLNPGYYNTALIGLLVFTVIPVIGPIKAPMKGMVTSGGLPLDLSKLFNFIPQT